jgi:hypothetical protein
VAIATKMLNDHTKPWVCTLQAMSSQGTNSTNVDDNHFMGELERTGNIAGAENVAKEVKRSLKVCGIFHIQEGKVCQQK